MSEARQEPTSSSGQHDLINSQRLFMAEMSAPRHREHWHHVTSEDLNSAAERFVRLSSSCTETVEAAKTVLSSLSFRSQ